MWFPVLVIVHVAHDWQKSACPWIRAGSPVNGTMRVHRRLEVLGDVLTDLILSLAVSVLLGGVPLLSGLVEPPEELY